MIQDSDEDTNPLPTPRPTAKRKRVVVSDDESQSADAAQKKKPAPKPRKNAVAASKPSQNKTTTSGRATAQKKRAKLADDDFVVSDEEESPSEKEEDSDEELVPTKRTKKMPLPTKSKSDHSPKPSSPAKPTPDATNTPPKPFNWAAAKAAKLAGPKAPGSKIVPEAKTQDCLLGLSFVFTGELTSFSRDEAVELAKRYGGRVTLQPSSKTSFVVLGENAGPSKLAAINKHGLRTLSEDEFLELIGTRVGPSGPSGSGGAGESSKGLNDKMRKKMEKEEQAIRNAAREMEKREAKEAKEQAKAGSSKLDASTQLWTTHYAPQNLKEICGNKGQIEKLRQWLQDWPASYKSSFKKPGKSGMNAFRAVLITGPPGIGKTTSAHLCARLEGYTPVEMNASDTRSKKLVEGVVDVGNRSLDGWMGGKEATNALGVTITDRTCLIMDEVDGMSAGDRGGVGALSTLIKKTKIPIICIANDGGAIKLKPLSNVAFKMQFRRPEASSVRSRMLTIAYKEKMKIPANVLDQLIEGAQSDIRQILNMLSTWRLSSATMSFDEGKNLAKANEKHTILTPFDVTGKMLGPYLFSRTARETLGDKIELYFHDHAFVPLFIQENYLKTQPAQARDLEGPPKMLKQLQLMDKAASSISDGDLVDALIHGPELHWSLMPLHAVCSAVRPASFVYGGGMGYAGPTGMSFPQWLGQNSKQNRFARQLGDIQVRMRLVVSGDRTEIRQSYVPAMYAHIVRPLVEDGADAVDEVISRMDAYYLSREDWDTVVELGVDSYKDDAVLKKIASATKSAFTRRYNASEHPIAFHRAVDLGKIPRKLGGGAAPDLEEAYDVDDEIDDDETKKPDNDEDVGGDKLIVSKANKGKGASQGKAKGKAKAKG
ncbi:replication factor RFC1 C terminal domain-containing protein [Scleroderma yunnanense]